MGVMSNEDLEKILQLLPPQEKEVSQSLIRDRLENPVTDYHGLWEPQQTPMHKMTRKEIMGKLKQFRDAWEKITTRNQDLPDDYIRELKTLDLARRLKWFYDESTKILAGDIIREYMRK